MDTSYSVGIRAEIVLHCMSLRCNSCVALVALGRLDTSLRAYVHGTTCWSQWSACGHGRMMT